ncbi:hypothetical protein GQ43DRAFT_470732 [Delitschia confertaspora ATCC 74209]|uniref:Altered inheritance of mitochondria protein 6 n=1 Tax=Delitschia confertaspora ATCC 74209 TaxID=1513339 RepID=A0A9P4JU62_9PLEO|nr:hypothetical protein GQ43DRAFT_470732 [Delitschia confertaspora ATCC 74209]
MGFLSILAFLHIVPLLGALVLPEVSHTLQNILKNTDNSNKYTYPTDLTRGIIPKAFHSHNDYWRDVPFYSGLSYGAISTEADVWLINGTLYVGHELSALTEERTFESLYVNPILDTLHRQNPITNFVTSPTRNGVFDADAGQTLYLFVDIKTGPMDTWSAVLSALSPLVREDYLSIYDGKTFKSGPVTIIGTGNAPLSTIQSTPLSESNPRYAFYDAPLPLLSSTFDNITRFDSPIASTNFAAQFGNVVMETMNSTQLDLLREQVTTAHEKGIKVRYWNQPSWPIGTRNAVWRTLIDEGVDFINVDDLAGAAAFWEGRG